MTTNTYLIKEGYENLKKHGSKTFSTMLIICATMLVLGIFMILFTNVNKNVETVKVEQGIQAFIEDTATDADIEYIKDAIKKIDGVGEIRYISKDEAYEDAKNTGEPTDKHSTQSTSEGSSLPKTGTPYSSKDLEDSEGVKQRRYYDKNGNADMDIDYRHGGTGHTFPHRHDWNNGVRGPAY